MPERRYTATRATSSCIEKSCSGGCPGGAFLMNTPTSWFDFGMSQLRYAV